MPGQIHPPDQTEQRKAAPAQETHKLVVVSEKESGVVNHHQKQGYSLDDIRLPVSPGQESLKPAVCGADSYYVCCHRDFLIYPLCCCS